jgi:molecular chaperone DnaK
MKRADLEHLAAPFIERTMLICRQAMAAANIPVQSFDAVVLVGGSTRIPAVQQRVAEIFKKQPHKDVNPEEVVALGAAIQAGNLAARAQRPAPVPPPLPAAAVPAGAIPPIPPPEPTVKAPPGPLLIDVTPLSLGVETAGGFTDVILAAGTPVPCDKTRIFVTAADRQTNVIVRVAQGESRSFAENTYLGECLLQNLRPAARGEVKIAVTFEIDANGILVVRAKDAETGLETRAHLRPFGAQLEAQDVATMQQRMAGRRIG